ncbi:superoxide dismutase, partial [Isoptericola sp. MSP01]
MTVYTPPHPPYASRALAPHIRRQTIAPPHDPPHATYAPGAPTAPPPPAEAREPADLAPLNL